MVRQLPLIGLLLLQGIVQPSRTGAVISGRIVSPDGKPAVGVRVGTLEADYTTDSLVAENLTLTDAEGRYRLEDVPAGTYYIVAGLVSQPTYFPGVDDRAQARSITVTAGAQLESIDFSIVASLTPSIFQGRNGPTTTAPIPVRPAPQPACTSTFAVSAGPVNDLILAADQAGNVFFAERGSGWVRKLTPDGNVTTVAGASVSLGPVTLLAADALGNLYIAEGAVNLRGASNSGPSPRIRKVNAAGAISTVAGNGVMGFSGDGGPAISAALCPPTGLAVDGQGNVYIASDPGVNSGRDFRVRKVDSSGVIDTVPGGTIHRKLDRNSELMSPESYRMDLGVDVLGNVFIVGTDEIGGSGKILKVTPTGSTSTVTNTPIQRLGHTGMASDGAGNVLLADGRVILRIAPDGSTTLIDARGKDFTVCSENVQSSVFGTLTDHRVSSFAVDGAGNFFFAESSTGCDPNPRRPRIRKFTPAGVISNVLTVADSKVSGQLVSTVPADAYAEIGFSGAVEPVPPVATLYLVRRDMDTGRAGVVIARPRIDPPNNGRFEITTTVWPGVYDAFASLPDIHGWDSQAPPGKATAPAAFGRTIVDARQDVSNVTIAVHPGVDLIGRITVDGQPAAPTGLQVRLQPDAQSAKIEQYRSVAKYRPGIGADGTFKFPALPEAQYTVAVDVPPQSNLAVADILLNGKSVTTGGISVGATSLGTLAIVLRTSP